MFNNIYKNKKVFITGHTGFKGSWLSLWLNMLGADVLGYALAPDTCPSLYNELKIDSKITSVIGDILDVVHLEKTMFEFKPDIVFHLAAQPLVRLSYKEPVATYMTNVIGTLNVLEAAKKSGSVKAFVNVTSDKCYENIEVATGYKENNPMGGYDMYSSSKGCVEIMSSSYRRSFLQNGNSFLLATARAGNVIGGGDWACDRLMPDCIVSINNGENIEVRNPMAIRPWQHVLEPLSGYLLLGQMLLQGKDEFADSFNFGPLENSVLNVCDFVQKVVKYYGKGEVAFCKKDELHEACLLSLNIEKAIKLLGWKPRYSADSAIIKTVDWYKMFYGKNTDMYEYTVNEIKDYEMAMG